MSNLPKSTYEEKFENPDYPAVQIAPYIDYFDCQKQKISKEEYLRKEEEINIKCYNIISGTNGAIDLARADGIITPTELYINIFKMPYVIQKDESGEQTIFLFRDPEADELIPEDKPDKLVMILFTASTIEKILERYPYWFALEDKEKIQKLNSERGKSELNCIVPESVTDFALDFEDLSLEEMEEKLLKGLQDLRMCNKDKYEFTYECPICLETSHDEKFLMKLCKCGHKCCLNCWKEHCKSVISFTADKLHCFECPELIPRNFVDVYKLVDPETMSNYDMIQYNKDNGTLVRCKFCNNFYLNPEKKTDCRCPLCHYFMCTLCCEDAHHQDDCNKSCADFEKYIMSDEYIPFTQKREEERLQIILDKVEKEKKERLKQEKLERKRQKDEERQRLLIEQSKQSEEWIASHTKACPKCKARIEKNHGCNHMTCTRCRHEFCWYCLKTIKNGNKGADYHFNKEKCPAGGVWIGADYY